ncbi:MAG: MarC family protein [Lentisphaeria bacterium]|nr:MarC family protein [Lentisphaeria bacterium]
MFMVFLNSFFKFTFLITPFFALSMFLAMTQGYSVKEKHRLALRVGISALAICLILFFFGRWLFEALGITIDSFRIGGGALLFLSAVGLVNSNAIDKKNIGQTNKNPDQLMNIAVVPLAIPIIVGPGTTAALLVLGAELESLPLKIVNTLSMTAALAVLTTMLVLSSWIEEKFGQQTITVLSKITGLILAAMAAQMIFTGVRTFLVVTPAAGA